MNEKTDTACFDILLVEDNEGDAFLTRKAFTAAGISCRIEVAEDGEQALLHLRRAGNVPDLILLDMNLPKCNGLEILRQIKGDEALKKIPVIVFSSSRAECDVQASYALHGNGYVLKPQSAERLQQIVEAINSFWLKTAILPPPLEVNP